MYCTFVAYVDTAINLILIWFDLNLKVATVHAGCVAQTNATTPHESHSVSNHRWLDCLFKHLFVLTIKMKKQRFILLALCVGNLAVILGFSTQKAGHARNVSKPGCIHAIKSAPRDWYWRFFNNVLSSTGNSITNLLNMSSVDKMSKAISKKNTHKTALSEYRYSG